MCLPCGRGEAKLLSTQKENDSSTQIEAFANRFIARHATTEQNGYNHTRAPVAVDGGAEESYEYPEQCTRS
jgi:hypothetical protein